MAPMGPADRGDARCVARSGKPIVNSRTDSSSLDRRIAGAMMPRDQQQHPLAGHDCLLEPAVDRTPGAIEIHAVEIEGALRLHGARAKPPVPASIERGARRWPTCRRCPRNRFWRRDSALLRRVFLFYFNSLRLIFLTRQRPNRCRDPGPELRLVRAELAHSSRCPWEVGSAPRPTPTFRPRSRPPQAPRPRTCRTGWVP